MKIAGKRAIIAAALAAAIVPVLAVAPAPAVIYGECSGFWTTSSVCQFPFAGAAFSVAGSATRPAFGVVNVYVRIVEPASGLVLMSCFAQGAGTLITCNADNQITTVYFVPLPAGALLQCLVSGQVSGTFSCSSRLA